MKTLFKLFFVAVFLSIAYYIIYMETERYESTSITLLKDLSQKQQMDFGSMLLGQSSSTMQDSKVLELYMRSNEMFNVVDKEYNLSQYYVSDKLDIVQRLYNSSPISFFLASKENLLKKYNENLFIIFDEPSGTLSLNFIHANPTIAKNILQTIIKHSDKIINDISKENAKVALQFIDKQREENKALFITSIKELINYQNIHHTIDPNMDVERKSTILINLESDLIKNEVEYNTKAKTYNLNGTEMKMIKESIRIIKKSILKIKAEMAGKNGKELNANVFNFQLLKSEMEFNKEIYKQTLVNLEELKIEVNQNAKLLIVVSQPTFADNYSYPNKVWDIFTLLIILFFFYNILITIINIIEGHRD